MDSGGGGTDLGALGALATGPLTDLATDAVTRPAVPFELRIQGEIVPAAVWKSHE